MIFLDNYPALATTLQGRRFLKMKNQYHRHIATFYDRVSLIFLVYTIYEAKRAPFDHAEAESELVAGHIIEFSGKSLLFFFFSEYIHLYFCMYLIFLFLFGNFETISFVQYPFFLDSFNNSYLLYQSNFLVYIDSEAYSYVF